MKTHRLWPVLLLGVLLGCPLRAEQTATVSGNRVNVRGQATLKSEVITQLMEGDTVVILEEINVPSAKGDEPSRWAKIRLPEGATVFVFAPYIDEGNQSVKVRRLNLRGGPGENYSVLGRIERGTKVKEVQTTASWMEIQAPEESRAYVAMNFLRPVPGAGTMGEPTKPSAPPASTPTTQTPSPTPVAAAPAEAPDDVPDPEVVMVETVAPETMPVVPVPTGATPELTSEVAPVQVAPTITMAPTEPELEDMPRRIVIREGQVVVTFSVQAPTKYALRSLATNRLINYLHTEQDGLNLKAFAGKNVFVTGEELLDARWAITPIMEVEHIRLAP